LTDLDETSVTLVSLCVGFTYCSFATLNKGLNQPLCVVESFDGT